MNQIEPAATWNDVVNGFSVKIREECRAGIVTGFRLPDAIDASTTHAVHQWAASLDGVELWIVDDLQGLANSQPKFVGHPVLQAFGIDDDHRRGLSVAEFEASTADWTNRMEQLRPQPEERLQQSQLELGSWFVWSGPLGAGRLVKGVFRETFDESKVWFRAEDRLPCPIYLASRGASQDHAHGGVEGVKLFASIFENSDDAPRITAQLLNAKDDVLATEGLLQQARIFALPSYD
jgi:hypothetical protein